MGRKRTKDKHLPRRVYFKNGRYWFIDRDGSWHSLGTTDAEMYRELASRVDRSSSVSTMKDVFDRYILEKLPLLAPRTQRDYRGYIANLLPVFGDAPPKEVTAKHIYDYRNKRAETSVVQANREKSCLSAVFSAAVEWGIVNTNPSRQVAKIEEPSRSRYVTDKEFTAVYRLASPMMQCAMDLATITGQREGDLLKLPNRDPSVYTDDGIVFRPGKSKRRHPRRGVMVESAKAVIVECSPELSAVVARARKLGPDIRKTLLCNLQGKPFTESGFRSNWHRLMQTALKGRKKSNGEAAIEPVLTESFTFHDLRAKSASDDENVGNATDRLAHDDPRTTRKVYLRKPRRARPGAKILDKPENIRQTPEKPGT